MKTNDWFSGLVFASALGSGLMGGLFFGFSALVMRALEKIPASAGIAAMQSINVSVWNVWFGLAFFGTPAVCLIAGVAAFFRRDAPGVWLIWVGVILYMVGSMGVTGALNVPMNDRLMALTATDPAAAAYWTEYLRDWTFWNHVRGLACFLTSALFTQALRS